MSKKLKELFKEVLIGKELGLLPASFDVVGDIMIFSDFPSELRRKEKLIGRKILKEFAQIKSVYKKSRQYSGKYRTPKLKLLAGEKKKETTHKEHNSRLKLNVEKVYFSPRLSTERKRIFQQIKKNENVLVLFSGCGVYPITITRNSNPKEVYGIEINPIAHKYALENIKLNKIENKIKLYLGDAGKILPKIKKKFDRILMPLPKGSESYLDITLKKIKKNGTIHLYTFAEPVNYNNVKELTKNECAKQKKKCRILRIVKCGQFSPRVFRICVDFGVS